MKLALAALVVAALWMLSGRRFRVEPRVPAALEFWCGNCGSYDPRRCCQNETEDEWRARFLVPLMADYSRDFAGRA